MAKFKPTDDPVWGYYGKHPAQARSQEEFTALARATKLRTLFDMSEREIRALEQFYGCRIVRPDRPKRARRSTGGAAAARA
jgi:hypothetical protein